MIREYEVLAISGIWDIPIETIRTRKPGPNIEERKRDSIIELMLFMESDNSQEKKETMPLPAIRKERRTPRKTDIKVITRASVMDIRAPSERRERKSLPYISVPRGWEEEKRDVRVDLGKPRKRNEQQDHEDKKGKAREESFPIHQPLLFRSCMKSGYGRLWK